MTGTSHHPRCFLFSYNGKSFRVLFLTYYISIIKWNSSAIVKIITCAYMNHGFFNHGLKHIQYHKSIHYAGDTSQYGLHGAILTHTACFFLSRYSRQQNVLVHTYTVYLKHTEIYLEQLHFGLIKYT